MEHLEPCQLKVHKTLMTKLFTAWRHFHRWRKALLRRKMSHLGSVRDHIWGNMLGKEHCNPLSCSPPRCQILRPSYASPVTCPVIQPLRLQLATKRSYWSYSVNWPNSTRMSSNRYSSAQVSSASTLSQMRQNRSWRPALSSTEISSASSSILGKRPGA